MSVTCALYSASAWGSEESARLLRRSRTRLPATRSANSEARPAPDCWCAAYAICKPTACAALAVALPTAPTRTRPARSFSEVLRARLREAANSTAFRLVISHQSNSPSLVSATSMTVVSSGGAKRSKGSAKRRALCDSSTRQSSGDSPRARETNTVLPLRVSGVESATHAPHFLKDGLRTILKKKVGEAFTYLSGLLG